MQLSEQNETTSQVESIVQEVIEDLIFNCSNLVNDCVENLGQITDVEYFKKKNPLSLTPRKQRHHEKFIQYCDDVYNDFASLNKVWLRYIRADDRIDQNIFILQRITKEIINAQGKSSITDELSEVVNDMKLKESYKRRPIGLAMIAFVGNRLFCSSSKCDEYDIWDKRVARYVCVDNITKLINNEESKAAEIDVSINLQSYCGESTNSWIKLMPTYSRQTILDLFQSCMPSLLKEQANDNSECAASCNARLAGNFVSGT